MKSCGSAWGLPSGEFLDDGREFTKSARGMARYELVPRSQACPFLAMLLMLLFILIFMLVFVLFWS
jgi:hypothetical protein